MLYIEHINLVVKDIPAVLKFYEAAFPHWKVRDEGDSDWYSVIIASRAITCRATDRMATS